MLRTVSKGDQIWLSDGTSGRVTKVTEDYIFLGKDPRTGSDPSSDYVDRTDVGSWSQTAPQATKLGRGRR